MRTVYRGYAGVTWVPYANRDTSTRYVEVRLDLEAHELAHNVVHAMSGRVVVSTGRMHAFSSVVVSR